MADPTDDTETGQVQPPLLRVVNPDATPAEIAALITVLTAVLTAALTAALSVPQAPATPTSGKSSEWPVSNRHRTPIHQRPVGWRASALPR